MPFTPFHLGPALAIGLPLRELIHAPTLILSSIVLDVEPLAVVLLGLDYPLHGFMHTLIFAVPVGAFFGWIMLRLENTLRPIYRKLLLESDSEIAPRVFIGTGVLGTVIHVMLDSPLYEDITPLFPFAINPAYSPGLSFLIYGICILAGALGLVYYLILWGLAIFRK